MSLSQFVSDQYTKLPIIPTPALCANKTFIVTGSNTGLGFEAAKHLVSFSPSRVILAVRTLKNGEAAKSKIEAETGKKGIAEVWQLDLSSYDSVKAFAKKVQGLDRLDAIIENASVALAVWEPAEGLETTLTVNVTSTFLLAAMVLPKLKDTARKTGEKTHLTVIGSGVAFMVPGRLEKVEGDILDSMGKKNNSVMPDRYQESKLLQLYAVRQLASLNPVSKTGVIINYINPGLCYSELTRNAPFILRTQINLMRLFFARSTEVGSRTLLAGAFAGEESHGKYSSECVVKDHYVPEWMTNESGRRIQQRVWDSLTNKLNTIQPGCV
ncbi:hypothetical protein AOL_s00080g207 [Orbilia oligospora ATCC 24927]|uniref:Ketoreductase (KR) domain-containing protein n=1 Tax=Arthrobotrys oligospora (strain ATCC 24927 / CBS 115.81 / DSM 1491) TaxID=756982 RepID=G1XEH2_ARTOA|nr:hypothetical protein AOL_s00080g207 [Orbilia oligospora ATCC 24927]EGX48578.1 hypothetical protein AOL_s00080g207 [Orbilia oligospora ATCC 24927]